MSSFVSLRRRGPSPLWPVWLLVTLQEYIKHNVEMRLYTIEQQVRFILYTKFKSVDDELSFTDFEQPSREHVVTQWMDGDERALTQAEDIAIG